MTWFGNFYRSAVGKKAVMAVSGVILFGFVFIHMIGNLKIYMGPEHLNEYAHWLRTVGAPAVPETGLLWIFRLVLLAAVVLHAWSAYSLTVMDWAARPVAYRHREFAKATYASRTMRWGGVIILLFAVYHILHFTTGQAHQNFVPGDPYHNVVAAFRIWWVSAFYILANLALGLHLFHGVWSMFNSLGITNARFESWRRNFATVFAVLVTLGNISIPIAVLLNVVR